MTTGLYTASKTKHAYIWKAWRAGGVPVVSTWIDEAGVGKTASFSDLWARCISEAANASDLLLYAEPGEVLKGALVELGAALANRVPVVIVGCQDSWSFRNHPLVTCLGSLVEARARFTNRIET